MNTNYSISISREAVKYLKKLDRTTRNRILHAIKGLQINPPLGDIVPLKAVPACYRLRVGSYRVIFTIDHDTRWIYVKAVGPRGNIYK